MNCKEFREIVDSYLSDELLTETNHNVIGHMEQCADCRSVIEARREIRTRLKNAVVSSPEYRLPEGFDHQMMTRIRHEANQESSSTGWFGFKAFATSFAELAVVAVLSFAFLGGSGIEHEENYLVNGFSADSLLNIASGDHEFCAIRHRLNELPIALEDAEKKYHGLDKVVEQDVGTVLAGHRLTEAHSCKYKDVNFAHIVMSKDDKTLSVLVAKNT